MMYTRLDPEFGDWAGFKPSKADPDLWMKDASDLYEYMAKYTDDILIMSKNPKAILDLLHEAKGP
eukprot:6032800-Ditylum_brightwellii.AAC.1